MAKTLMKQWNKIEEIVENGKIVHKKRDSYEIGRPFCLCCYKWCDVISYRNQAMSCCCYSPFRLTQIHLTQRERKEFKLWSLSFINKPQ